MLIFNITSPALANHAENGLSVTMNNLSKTEKQIITNHLVAFEVETAESSGELSEENKQIASKSLENYEENLIYADIKDGEKNIILGTDNENTFVAITDGTIDVVERISETDFLINGERHHFEITISDGPDDNQKTFGIESNDRTIQLSGTSITGTSTLNSTWTLSHTKSVNVNAQRNFHTYTVSALGGIIGSIVGGVFGGTLGSIVAGAGVGMAYNYIASSEYPTNVGRSNLYVYTQGRSPLTDYKTVSYDYAVYYGKNIFLGTSTTIKRSCVGCGV